MEDRLLEALIQVLYRLEQPILRKNDWDSLRVSVSDWIGAAAQAGGPTNGKSLPELREAVRELRRRGRIMLFPDWSRWGVEFDAHDGETLPGTSAAAPETAQWEPGHTPLETNASWSPRPVFLPSVEVLDHWIARSRVAETVRLLSSNRERFGLAASTGHIGYELQERQRPERDTRRVRAAVEDLQEAVAQGEFPGATPARLRDAIEVVGRGFSTMWGKDWAASQTIAAFQERSWHSVLTSLFGPPSAPKVTMLTAGVSSGKTYGFLFPALTLLVYRALEGKGRRVRVIVAYPRTSLVEDQFTSLGGFLEAINKELAALHPGVKLTEPPALDAGRLLAQSLELPPGPDGKPPPLGTALERVAIGGIEIILTTPESLKNRMIDWRAASTYLANAELVVFDEVHTLEGMSGSNGVYLVRRLRHLMRSLRTNQNFEPAWVGASATVANPREHAARVFSVTPTQVRHVQPEPDELERFGTFHHVFVHTRPGRALVSAVTNGLSCLVHTRNDSTAHAHYQDPSALDPQPLDTGEMPKTLVFMDSLSAIGRIRFTTQDNEGCLQTNEEGTPPPFYSWFFRPAARRAAPKNEITTIGEQTVQAVQSWCKNCWHGKPDKLNSSHLKHPQYAFLRPSRNVPAEVLAKKFAPPGFGRMLAQLPPEIGNLDQCPFLKARLCWWFSQDGGQKRTVDQVPVWIDQNRAFAYTSHTQEDPELADVHQNVDDYFQPGGAQVWPRALRLARRKENAATMLASPRIEVGVDFRNVRDGVTHKALRSAASFQQKAGRVGREDGSDSLVVTFLAHRTADAHFAHHPDRLIDPTHLDPIPLKADNRDVARTHLFTAILEHFAVTPSIADSGQQIDVIGTGSQTVPPWDAKVQGCLAYLQANGPSVRSTILAATRGQKAANQQSVDDADAAIAVMSELLEVFVTDLSPAYEEGGTPALWFKENVEPTLRSAFQQLLVSIDQVRNATSNLAAYPQAVATALDTLVVSLASPSLDLVQIGTQIQAAMQVIPPALMQVMVAKGDVQPLNDIFGRLNTLQGAVSGVTLPPGVAFPRLRKAVDVTQAFFKEQKIVQRIIRQYYLHNLLTEHLSYRSYYPYGLVRNHFQHMNERSVVVRVPFMDDALESLDTALYELLPGTWNYRWVKPLKSPSGPIGVRPSGEHYIDVARISGPHTLFAPTGLTLGVGDLPSEVPGVSAGEKVPVLRPEMLELRTKNIFNQPQVRLTDKLVGDDDEREKLQDPQGNFTRECPTLPRAFPATWYRVPKPASSVPIKGCAANVTFGFPAIGRTLFSDVRTTNSLKVDRYVYAIDRTYGLGPELDPPRIFYRRGPEATTARRVVIGDTLLDTDALVFHLRPQEVDAVLDEALAIPSIRGEITARAIRRFVTKTTACDPFQAATVRRVILAQHLSAGGTLRTLGAAAVQAALQALDSARFATIANELVVRATAGDSEAAHDDALERQRKWYKSATTSLEAVRVAASQFDDAWVREVARDILVHTIAVVAHEALSRLVGASDQELGYFHHAAESMFYIFDTVDGGHGGSEVAARFLQIPPLARILDAQQNGKSDLPTSDGFMILEESLATCPAQSAARVLAAAHTAGASSLADLSFPPGVFPDLEARVRHEFDTVNGSWDIVHYLMQTHTSTFAGWQDLLWLELVPEWFNPELVQAHVSRNLSDLRQRAHVCVSGCLECVDNGEGSIYGGLASRENVSRTLLDLVRERVVKANAKSFIAIPAGTPVAGVVQTNVGVPVLDDQGQPVSATIAVDGQAPWKTLLTRVLSTVAPDLSLATPAVTAGQNGKCAIQVPFLVGYRDEAPVP